MPAVCPSDTILWENIEYSYNNRACRACVVNIVLLFVLIGGFFGIIVLSFYKVDVTYLKACGAPDEVDTVLYDDPYCEHEGTAAFLLCSHCLPI
eukprot:SAG22_NODE_6753_length_815_cov_2.308659_1_plen_94_part_00